MKIGAHASKSTKPKKLVNLVLWTNFTHTQLCLNLGFEEEFAQEKNAGIS